jgi:DUF4097 and DUF4098 domain-containing protein YvlB
MKFAAFATAAFVALVAGTGTEVSFAAGGRNLSTVNGDVTAVAGETYDTLSAVNGEVLVSRGATVDTVRTVNGEVKVESESKLGSASTVNGELEIAGDVTVSGNASTVNGSVKIAQRTHVGGDVSTVSGEIELAGAEVGGLVSTVNGDIDLSDGAHVRGGILVKKPNSDNWMKKGHEDPVKIHICGTCVVDGDLRFERAAELRVDNGARIGKVIGDNVKRL